MEIELSTIVYIVGALVLIIGIMTSVGESYNEDVCESDICQYPGCRAPDKIPNFKTLVRDFSASKVAKIPNALENTNQFTLSAILNVSSYNQQPEWQRLFHAGDYSSRHRTPGVWINQGFLHIRATTSHNFNEGQGCWKIDPPLEPGTHYHLVLVYNRKKIEVYLDGQKIRTCPTVGIIKPGRDLYVGRWGAQRQGANINMTLSYLPAALNEEEVKSCWLDIKGEIGTPLKTTPVKKSDCDYSSHSCPSDAVFIQDCKGGFLTVERVGASATFEARPKGPMSCFRFTSPVFNPRGANGKACSIESVAFPGNYLRHAGYILRLNNPSLRSGSQHLREDFVFTMHPGLSGNGRTVTLRVVQPNFGRGCLYSDARHLRFRSRHCPSDGKFKHSASLHVGRAFNAIPLSNRQPKPKPKPKPAPRRPAFPNWTKCARENGVCPIRGPVGRYNFRYGARGRFVNKTFNKPSGRNINIQCNNRTHGDPIVGTVKDCWFKSA